MRVDVLTKEYPPEVYGGAGVHVAELVRALRARDDLDARVHAFGAPRDEARHRVVRRPRRARRRQRRAADPRRRPGDGRRLRRRPTWCTRTPGTPTWPATSPALLHGVPHVVTAHSLEPMRPWKAEQLGGGYAVSSWAERTAYEAAAAVIAVSAAMRDDVLRAYPASTRTGCTWSTTASTPSDWSPGRRPRPGARRSASTRTGPSVVFVGRITRQKGLPLFLRAVAAAAARGAAGALRGRAGHPRDRGRGRRRWSTGCARHARRRRLDRARCCPRADVVALLTAATAFACPSIYEPLGIVNLEAMACETAVVATATGGIPEVVVRRRDRAAGADRAGHRRHRHPARPGPVRRRLRRRAQRGGRRPRPGRRDGPGRPAAGDRGLQLGRDRRADRRGLPLGALA